jgi:hypothetical protein
MPMRAPCANQIAYRAGNDFLRFERTTGRVGGIILAGIAKNLRKLPEFQ